MSSKRAAKGTLDQKLFDLLGNPARDVYPAARSVGEREIARDRAVHGTKHRQSSTRSRLIAERRGAYLGRRELRRRAPGELTQGAIQVLKPFAGEKALDRYALRLLPHELERAKFIRGAGGEAHVSPLGRHRHRPIPEARETGHAEPRAGTENRDRATLESGELRADGVQMFLIEQVDGQGDRRKR